VEFGVKGCEAAIHNNKGIPEGYCQGQGQIKQEDILSFLVVVVIGIFWRARKINPGSKKSSLQEGYLQSP